MNRGVLALLIAGTSGAAPAAAQTEGSFGVGVGTVRYSGGTSFSSATFSPAFHASSPRWAADAFGSAASLDSGRWSIQGRAEDRKSVV